MIIVLSDGLFITDETNQDVQINIGEYESVFSDILKKPIDPEIEERDRIAFALQTFFDGLAPVGGGGPMRYTASELRIIADQLRKQDKYKNDPDALREKLKEIEGEEDDESLIDLIFDDIEIEEFRGENTDSCQCGNCESESGRDELCDSCKDIESFDDEEEEEEFFFDPDDFTDGR